LRADGPFCCLFGAKFCGDSVHLQHVGFRDLVIHFGLAEHNVEAVHVLLALFGGFPAGVVGRLAGIFRFQARLLASRSFFLLN